MTYSDDEFVPRLGRIRSPGSSKRAKTYLRRVLRAIALAGLLPRGGSPQQHKGFHGNRIGRGAGVGRVLAGHDRYAAFRARRVIVKTRIVKMSGKGLGAARLHLRYIQRDRVTREGAPASSMTQGATVPMARHSSSALRAIAISSASLSRPRMAQSTKS
jgi:hypothetical protein